MLVNVQKLESKLWKWKREDECPAQNHAIVSGRSRISNPKDPLKLILCSNEESDDCRWQFGGISYSQETRKYGWPHPLDVFTGPWRSSTGQPGLFGPSSRAKPQQEAGLQEHSEPDSPSSLFCCTSNINSASTQCGITALERSLYVEICLSLSQATRRSNDWNKSPSIFFHDKVKVHFTPHLASQVKST